MKLQYLSRLPIAALAATCGLMLLPHSVIAQSALKRLPGHMPPLVSRAERMGRVQPSETISLALTLPLRNETELDALIERLSDPADPIYGQYLTSSQFAAHFAPTSADYAALAAFAREHGLTVTGTHANRLVLDVAGPAGKVESAFGVHLHTYRLPDGREFRAPNDDPLVPAAIGSRLKSVIGLDNARVWRTHSDGHPVSPLLHLDPRVIGSGPGGGLTPGDIKTAYNLNGTALNGSGQTLAVFELDGYAPSDITTYEQYYGLPNVPVQNVLVDGYNGAAGQGAGEVTLDIQLQIALAPGAAKILVYEGPNSSQGVLDTYNRIATDDLAKSVSTSWGLDERTTGPAMISAEASIFKQMAAQGQSVFAAGGDNGAYDNGSSLSIDDPASQRNVTGAGGTTLATTSPGGPRAGETAWNSGSIANGAGGGGSSLYWAIPNYQSQAGVISTASGASTTMRNVPDVALNADPNTGYSAYIGGQWNVVGGTSCAAPLWAAFTALVNQQRALAGKGTLGMANPALYAIGVGANGDVDFHDIADNSNNLFYHAVAGYDLATGWGSFNGVKLLADLAGSTLTPPAVTQLLGNPGFENGANPAPWFATSGVINNSNSEPPHFGQWKACLDGYGRTHTDILYQKVTIPATITSATLLFYLHIDTAESTTTAANDTLKVQVRNSNGALLTTLVTYSNLDAASGYRLKTFDLSAYKGQTILVALIGMENDSLQTSFVVDDFALNAQ